MVEHAVMEAIKHHPESERWKLSIIGFQAMGGFVVRIERETDELVGAWLFDGPRDRVGEEIALALMTYPPAE